MYTLVVGNKNYSSWSLRPYLALAHVNVPFDEVVIPLDQPETKAAITKWSKAGRLPVLRHGPLTIWDSLAICEYLAENHPEAKLWPDDLSARGVARSVVAEMHSGFVALRNNLSMDLRGSHPGKGLDAPGVAGDIARIQELWSDLRKGFGAAGPFLFGRFSIADCFYAPVATRFRTYGVPLDGNAAAYVETIYGLPAFRAWLEAAKREPWELDR